MNCIKAKKCPGLELRIIGSNCQCSTILSYLIESRMLRLIVYCVDWDSSNGKKTFAIRIKGSAFEYPSGHIFAHMKMQLISKRNISVENIIKIYLLPLKLWTKIRFELQCDTSHLGVNKWIANPGFLNKKCLFY